MKKFLLLLVGFALTSSIYAQAPQAFKFQSVIRDASGMVLPLQDITLKFLIHVDTPDGEVVYAEQHLVTTNASGLANVDIGSGEIISGTFEGIIWGDGTYFLEEQIDVANTGNFQVFGTVQLLSVPYALHANTAGNGIQSMSEEERDAIESPAVGMQIYNTTTNCLNYWNGTNWFETCGECTPQPSDAHAGPDQSYTDSTTVVVLEGNTPEEGTGLWTKNSGYPGWFEDPNDPNSTFHGEPCRYYYLKWTISNTCGSDDDYVKVTFDHLASEAVAGQDTVIITEATEITLYAQAPESGSGEWSVISGDGGEFIDPSNPTTTFTGLSCNTYELDWSVSTECHENADTLTITFDAIPTPAFAGQDTIVNDDNLTIQLNANEAFIGNGEWSIFSGEGGVFSESTNPQTEFTGESCTNYELLWVISTDCHSSTDTVNIYFFSVPTQADAGEDQLGLEGSWTTLEANEPEIGEGQWTILSGEGGQITSPNSPTSIFLGQINENYILQWQISTACDITTDEVNVAFGYVPYLNCGDTLIDDRDGQKYTTVQIGEQCWMAENLAWLPFVYPPEIGSSDLPIYYVQGYEGYEVNQAKTTENFGLFGVLYNWTASISSCPTGWHLPEYDEWSLLSEYLGGSDISGGKLKEVGTTIWNPPNTGATNESGFSGLPGGNRIYNGSFHALHDFGNFWSTTEVYDQARGGTLCNNNQILYLWKTDKDIGQSVRCIMNDSIPFNHAPIKPSNPIPEDNASALPLNVQLNWQSIDPDQDPLMYDVYLSSDSIPLLLANGISDTFYLIDNLNYSTKYFWKIFANDNHGNSTESNVWSFSTKINPEWTCGDTIVDTRDEHNYATTQVGNQCWMIDNLAYLPEVSPSTNGSNNEPYYYVYGYQGISTDTASSTENYHEYGVLYNWSAADISCPVGWHLPSDDELKILEGTVDSQYGVGDPEWNSIGYRGFDAEQNLKSVSGWDNNGNGIDLYKFDAIPSGDRDIGGTFENMGSKGCWWSSTQFSSSSAWYRALFSEYTEVYRNFIDKRNGQSVRCINNSAGVLNQPPNTPSNPQPVNESLNVTIYTTLFWSCSDPQNEPLTFDVYFGNEALPTIVVEGISDTFYIPATLESNTVYFWKIVAHDDHGNSTESPIWSFGAWDCGNPFIDERDGNEYETVQIGGQCWMAENLNIGTMINGINNQTDNEVIEKYCYNDSLSNCDAFGGIYQWNEMMQYNEQAGAKGICMEGWHLPTDAEWCILEQEVDPTISCGSTNWRGVNGGTKLKQGGSSGFEALLGGERYYDGSFYAFGLYTYFWSSSEQSGTTGFWCRALLVNFTTVGRWSFNKEYGYSVRCTYDNE